MKQQPLRGAIAVPGDKSLSHRALLFAALADGTSRLTNLNRGSDVGATARCLRLLGASISGDNDAATVQGGRRSLGEPSAVLDAGNSGTTIRTLLGLCASLPGLTVLTGDDSLLRRPMLRVVAPLREMGARIDGRRHGDLAPLAVRGGELQTLDKDLIVASAQVKTAILVAGLSAAGTTAVGEPGPSRDHTERMLGALGVPIQVTGHRVELTGPATPTAMEFEVPGDVSSAMFLIAAALLVPGSDLTLTGVGLNPTRTGALEVLASMGADISWDATEERLGEPVGTIGVRHSALKGVDVVGADLIPRLIDEIPVLAVLATQAEGTTRIAGAAELRVKESDRIAAMTGALSMMGAEVVPAEDGLIITGPTPLGGGAVDAGNDHRVAMAVAIAGLASREKVTVKGWGTTETSFPEFLDLLGEARSRR
jgi:3-phosphoshikimate 1-carboxyvinyltransferase